MAHVQTSTLPPLKSSEVRHPFGLPLGSVRGLMSILICVFFWILLLLPTETPAKAVLAHFFLLGLVLLAFASSPRITDRDESPFLPWLMRLIFVGGSIAVVAFVLITRDPTVVQHRLTPDPDEVRMWWIPFLGSLAGGFSLGLLLRFLLGQLNHVFQSMRAWFSVLGLVLLACELGIFFIMAGGAGKVDEFLHYCQCVTIVIVSAYFGTRA
jgi:hypothetical protein